MQRDEQSKNGMVETAVETEKGQAGQQLINKMLWDIQLGLRKFMHTAEIVLENDIWQEDIPEETVHWLRDWYPYVKSWMDQLRALDESRFSLSPAAGDTTDFLFANGEKRGLIDLLDTAPQLPMEKLDQDTVGYSLGRHLLRLRPLNGELLEQFFIHV